jgi:cytochrome c oxidase assembly factor CtaG
MTPCATRLFVGMLANCKIEPGSMSNVTAFVPADATFSRAVLPAATASS